MRRLRKLQQVAKEKEAIETFLNSEVCGELGKTPNVLGSEGAYLWCAAMVAG